MKEMDLASVVAETGSNYPYPFNLPCNAQSCQRLARHGGLSLFGVNLTVIEPGSWSSQRHWHSHEDEFIWVVEGELTLVTDSGEELLRAGDCAAFRAWRGGWHHLINKSARLARVLEIGNSDTQDRCVYSDIDMTAGPGGAGYRHRDGTPNPPKAG
jgi:uncharacterized cupin superfamily protein